MRLIRNLGLATAGAAAAVALLAGTATAKPVVLHNSRSPVAARSPRVGSVPSNTAMHFEINLKLPDLAAAQAFARAVSTPGSAAYGHYLSAARWEARFAPSAAAVNRVRAFLTGAGLTVAGTSADRMAVSVSGTASQVERVFRTSLSYHTVDGAKLLLADTNLSVPSAVAGLVAGVTGVSDSLAHPADTTGTPPVSAPTTAAAPGDQPPGFRVAHPCGTYFGHEVDTALPLYAGYPADPPWAVCGYTGPQLRSAYGLSGSNTGAGVTVAIVDAYVSPTLLSDGQQFASLNDPTNPLSSSQFSELLASKFTDGRICDAPGWYGEQTLDVEAVHNMAPGANILAAGAQSCFNTALNDSLRRIIDGHLASVITNSYGDNAGDVLDSADDRRATDNLLLMAASTGISVLFSSGDSGDEFVNVGLPVADYPASSPWATAVGGTTLEVGSQGQRLGEYGWSTARSFLCNETFHTLGACTKEQEGTWLPIDLSLDGGSGGGTSFVYTQPFYQDGVVPIGLSTRNSPYIGPHPMRVEPDVSMEADPATGMLVGETQTFPNGTFYDQYRIGGTSVASPLLAGVIARADQTAGHSLGFLNPILYSLYGNSSALYDVRFIHQDMSRADFANSIDSSQGFLYSTRIVNYEGQEQFCNPLTGVCSSRDVALDTTSGFDSMTGLGSPNSGFVGAVSSATVNRP